MANDKKNGNDKERRRTELAPSMNLFDELERYFGNLAPRGWMRPFHWDDVEGRIPRVDVVDDHDTLVVRAELPGVSKDDIDVTLSDNLLTISTRTRREKESGKDEKGKYQRREIYQGSFSRSLTLPVGVDADQAQSSFRDGILELRLPKVEQARRRSIPVGD